MPYIKSEDRVELIKSPYQMALYPERFPKTAGELNYVITLLIHNFLARQDLSYTKINEVIGVLECAKLELYRQIAVPYEDKKKTENGPVSHLDNGGS